jgi:peroxiredoxin
MDGKRIVSAVEEDDFYPQTLQEELNEIIEALYATFGEDYIRTHQQLVEYISESRIADAAVQHPGRAPDFELTDQDGDNVCLSELLEKGPVVLVFYRGKWCPHCNATLMRLQRELEKMEGKGASLVAISPMLPDGTQYLATKRSLMFPVCSDLGNKVARKFKITFEIPLEFRENHLDWGMDIPAANGYDTWEIPLPATYVIDQTGEIVWSYIDDDPVSRAEPEDIVAAIPSKNYPEEDTDHVRDDGIYVPDHARKIPTNSPNVPKRRNFASTFTKTFKRVFGRKRQSPRDFLGHYCN